MSDRRFRAGEPFPSLSWPKVGGGTLSLANDPGWRLLVVYRGQHCGLCREYLAELNGMLDAFSRPDLQTVLEGLATVQNEHAPIHGTAP